MILPANRDAEWAAGEYAAWLRRVLRNSGRGGRAAQRPLLSPVGSRPPLLVLKHAQARSSPDRQLLFIGRGMLSKGTPRGRFELRQVLDGRTLLVAIHDYGPRLPWFVYVALQAPVHAWIMAGVRRHLATAGGPRPVGRTSSP